MLCGEGGRVNPEQIFRRILPFYERGCSIETTFTTSNNRRTLNPLAARTGIKKSPVTCNVTCNFLAKGRQPKANSPFLQI